MREHLKIKERENTLHMDQPSQGRRVLHSPAVLWQIRSFLRGYTSWRFCNPWITSTERRDLLEQSNQLRLFFDGRKEGLGIWKWHHYFDIYERHFKRFRGCDVRVLEIGIFSGGSLEMWREYFGPRSQIYGIDIEPGCKTYENEFIKVFIGDQSSRDFWK